VTAVGRGVSASSKHLMRGRSRILLQMSATALTVPISVVASAISITNLRRIRSRGPGGVTKSRGRRALGRMIRV
jgi:hypothetical protein